MEKGIVWLLCQGALGLLRITSIVPGRCGGHQAMMTASALLPVRSSGSRNNYASD